MRINGLARRYAKAAFDVAAAHGNNEGPQSWQADLKALAEVLTDPSLAETLRSPRLTNEQKSLAIETQFPGLRPELKNLVRLLISRHRITMLPQISAAFDELVDEMMGRAHADMISARPLRQEELVLIQEKLDQRTGLTVRLSHSIDPTIIGGVIIRLNDQLIDGSVLTRLERLRQRLA